MIKRLKVQFSPKTLCDINFETAQFKCLKQVLVNIKISQGEKLIKWLNFRIPRHFGPPHLHVSGGFEDRGITQ